VPICSNCERTGIDLVASGERVEDGAGIAEFLLDVKLGFGIVRIFQVAVRIDDFVPLDGILNRGDLGLRRPGRHGGIATAGVLCEDHGNCASEKNQKESQQS
jgi:hypothetical protein